MDNSSVENFLWSNDNPSWSWSVAPDEKTIEIIQPNLGLGLGPIMEENTNEILVDEKISLETENMIETAIKCICIDDILTKNPEALKASEVIQYEFSIAHFVQILLEGSAANNKTKTHSIDEEELNADKISSIIDYLKWISDSSKTLANRIGQSLIDFQPERTPTIIRSSYNFCSKNIQCKNFYSKNESPTCQEHHYVHSVLRHDINSVIAYLIYITKNNIVMKKEDWNNIYLSIKTICFVTRHMAKEIGYIESITNNSENFHRSNPAEFIKKKNFLNRTSYNKVTFESGRNKNVPPERKNTKNPHKCYTKKNTHKNYTKQTPVKTTKPSNIFANLLHI